MLKNRKEAFLNSVYSKVAAAFFIGLVAVGSASLISKVGFNDMLETVERLSAPNEKLKIVNNLFYRVIQLENLQHAYAIENPENDQKKFSPEIKQVLASVDSLRELCQENPVQLERVDSMETLLVAREKLARSYFNLRADLEKNRALNKQVITLSKQMANLEPKAEVPKWKEKNRVVTSTKKTTKISIIPPKTRKERRKAAALRKKTEGNFFQRLFAFNLKESPAKIKKGSQEVKEEVHVKIDTFSIGREYRAFLKADKDLRVVERELRVVERNYFQRSASLIARELALVKASNKLNHELINLLKTFEAEEVGQVKGDYYMATSVVNSSISRMNNIILVFFLGSSLFGLLIILDVARGKKLQTALQKAKDEAEHLSQMKHRFLANMSHELRTPLQSILGFSEQVKGQKNPDPEALDAIFCSSEHLLQIVNEVLDYSRIISGKFTFEKKPFDVQQLASEVVATLAPQATKKDLKLKVELDCKNSRYVSGDAFRLRQVLYNLLGNAIKFTEKGNVSLTVKCSQVGDRGLFSFKVKDSGIGIPEKDISRIFNQFEQSSSNEVQKHGGTGLGLSIAKSLIESQGGQLTVTSKVGEGSVFEIQIPYELVEKPSGLIYHDTKITEATFEGEIAIVDDDAIILKLCGAILDKHKIKNIPLRSAKTAAETNWSKDLKLVFTDIQMPEMNGFELCKAIKQKVGSEVKVYAMTARALPEEHAEILAQGFDGILMKPFREQELLQILNSFTPVASNSLLGDVTGDFGSIGYICGDDEIMFQSMLQLFVTETRTDLELLNIYLAGNQQEKATEVIHKLAGCIGQLGAMQLSEKLRSHEKDLKGKVKLETIKAEVKTTILEIEKFVELASQKAEAIQDKALA